MPKRSLLRDLSTVLGGAAGAQLLGILILPLLSRNFSQEAFGAFQVYFAVLVFLSVGASLKMEIALLSKPEEDIERYTQQLIGLSVATSTVITAILVGFDTFVRPLGFPAFLMGIALIGTGITQIISYRLIRRQSFRQIASLKVVQVFVYAVIASSIALTQPSLWGLIVADVAGRWSAAGLAIFWSHNIFAGAGIRFRGMVAFIKENKELVLISLPGSLANAASAMLTPVMIFSVYGAALAGQYGLVDRALGAPIAMLVMAGSQVFSGRMSNLITNGEIAAARANFLRLALPGLFVTIAGSVIAYPILPYVFEPIFGPGWDIALEIAQIMIFAYAVILVSGVVNQTLILLRAYRLQAFWDIGRPLGMGAIWAAVIVWEADIFAAIYLHAAVVGGLGLAFLAIAALRLRTESAKAQQGG